MAQQADTANPPAKLKRGFEIDSATRANVIARIVTKLNELYVFPNQAQAMEKILRAHQSNGDYDAISKGNEFAELLTAQLRDVSHDKHLSVTFSPETLPDFAAALTPQQMEANRRRDERINCAFTKVEILDHNIGYVKIGGFGPTDICAPTVTAAMNFVANADAVILDMRGPGGGEALTVVFLESYLFSQPTHVNDVWTRSTDTIRQYWTRAQVPGKRVSKAPVFVLTSSRTFSAGEELAYDLQSQKRATIVGETTGGGANPFRPERIDDRFALLVPFGRAINPITKSNWERVGVEPDVKVPEVEALATAQKLAAEKIAALR